MIRLEGHDYLLLYPWGVYLNHRAGLQYTLMERFNLSNPELKFMDVPKHKLRAFLHYTLFSRLFLNLNGMYNSSRLSTTDGVFQTEPFFTMDFLASVKIFQGSLSMEASFANLLDASYSYMEGYPAPGRQFSLGLRYELR